MVCVVFVVVFAVSVVCAVCAVSVVLGVSPVVVVCVVSVVVFAVSVVCAVSVVVFASSRPASLAGKLDNGILAVSVLYIVLGLVVLVVVLLFFLTSWSDGVGSDVVSVTHPWELELLKHLRCELGLLKHLCCELGLLKHFRCEFGPLSLSGSSSPGPPGHTGGGGKSQDPLVLKNLAAPKFVIWPAFPGSGQGRKGCAPNRRPLGAPVVALVLAAW